METSFNVCCVYVLFVRATYILLGSLFIHDDATSRCVCSTYYQRRHNSISRDKSIDFELYSNEVFVTVLRILRCVNQN